MRWIDYGFSVLERASVIGNDCTIRDTVVLGSDKFETAAQKRENARLGRPDLNVGEGTVIERAILDKECRVGRGVKLVNREKKQDFDGPSGLYYIRDGIICIPRGTVIPDGTII